MDEQNPNNVPQSRVKKGSYRLKFLSGLIAALVIIGIYFYLQKGISTFPGNQEESITPSGESELTNPADSHLENSEQVNKNVQPGQETQLGENKTSSDVSENNSIIAD